MDENKRCCVKQMEKLYQRVRHPFRNGFKAWLLKYFWEGQLSKHDNDDVEIDVKESLVTLTPTRRKIVAFLAPGVLLHFFWWAILIKNDYWHLFTEKYSMTITMIFGSVIAGMTSEGGGAIAFPVMTLVLRLSPSIARDFSFMIQSFGMTCAASTIYFMKIKLERSAIIFTSIGGVFGMIVGLHLIDPNLTPPQKKMGFVSIWFAFAFTLYLLNREHKRTTFKAIPNLKAWKVVVLFMNGFVGGCFSAFAGSGIDICSFSVLCLFFRVSEKVATPTSVVLMAINTVVGFAWRGLVMQEIEKISWEYLMVCIPVVVIGAPLGSLLGSHFHRLVLAAFVYVIDTVALIGAFCVVPQTPMLAGVSVAIIVGFFIFFVVITKLGAVLMERQIANTKGGDIEGNGENTLSEEGHNVNDDCRPHKIDAAVKLCDIDNNGGMVDNSTVHWERKHDQFRSNHIGNDELNKGYKNTAFDEE